MNYYVKHAFRDKEDGLKPYSKGETYSSENEERVAFLMEKGFLEEKSKQPPQGEKEFPKHAGGGYFELSNGDKVRGKEEAEITQAKLDAGEEE